MVGETRQKHSGAPPVRFHCSSRGRDPCVEHMMLQSLKLGSIGFNFQLRGLLFFGDVSFGPMDQGDTSPQEISAPILTYFCKSYYIVFSKFQNPAF